RVERKHADLQVERVRAELNAAVRRDIHYWSPQHEIIRVEEPARALEIGDDRFERDSIDTRVRNLRAQPILDVDKTEQARKQRELVEGSVSDRHRHVAGKGFKEVCVGVGPQIDAEKKMTQQWRLLVLAAQHEERR